MRAGPDAQESRRSRRPIDDRGPDDTGQHPDGGDLAAHGPPGLGQATMPAGVSVPSEPSPASGPVVGSAASSDSPPLRHQHARRRRNHRILVWSSVALVVMVLASTGVVAAQRVDRPLPQPTVAAGTLASSVVPGPTPVPPWPAAGQAAVAVPALGFTGQSGPEEPVPIASLTKMTTALVVLRDHPVPLGESGPTVTITPDEASQFGVDLGNDETNIPLQPGETLTELQLLEALLNQSADDVAYTLAVWDAGSQPAFVAKMNLLAASLGAVHSHYVDASGFDPQSMSTAADTLYIAAAGMAIPTFASVAGMPTVNLPGVGTAHNIVTAIGTDGIVGVKSGYTSEASGCMVLAGFRSVDGRAVLVLASALGQREPAPGPPPSSPAPSPRTPPAQPAPTPAPTTTTAPYSAIEAKYPLRYTEPIVEHLLDASEAAIVRVPVVAPGHTVGTASAEWGGAHHLPVIAASGAWLLGVPGQRVDAMITRVAPSGATATGPVGTVRFTLGLQTEIVPVRLLRRPPAPGWWWKLLHNS